MAIKVSCYSVEVSDLLVKWGNILGMQSWKWCRSGAYSPLAEKAYTLIQKYLHLVFSCFTAFFFSSLLHVHHQLKKGESKIQSSLLWSSNFFVSCERVLLLNALSAAGDRADRLWAGSMTVKSHRQGCWWLWQIAWLLCCGSASHSDFLNLIISRSFHEEMLWQAEILFQWLPATHTCLSK